MPPTDPGEIQRIEALNRLGATLDAIPDLLFEVGLDGHYFAFHSPRTDLLAVPVASFLGKTIPEIMPPDVAAICMAALQEAHETGRSSGRQYVLSVPSGRLWFELSVSRLPVPEGDVPRFIVVSRDITERKRAEEALRESEARLQCILGATADGILAVGRDGRVLLANPRFAQLWRIPPEMLEAHDDDALLAHVVGQLNHPEAFIQRVRLVYESDEETTDTITFKDGRVFERYSAPLRVGGVNAGRVWSFHDVTERTRAEVALRESRNLLQSIIDTAPVRVFWKDKDLRYLGCNPAFAMDAGGAVPGDVVGSNDFDLIWKEHAEQYRADDLAVMITGVAKLNYLEPHTNSRGTERWLRTSKVPLTRHDGTIFGVLGIYEDITEQQRTEQRLSMAVEVARLVLWELELATGALRYDRGALVELGLGRDAELGSIGEWQAAIHPEDRDRFTARFNWVMTEEEPTFDLEYRIADPGRPYEWVHTRARICGWDAAGRPTLAVGTSMNITARKEIEAAKRESDERSRALGAMLRLLCDNVPDMIWAKDLENRFVFANRSHCQAVLGAKDTDEPIGQTDLFFALRERARHPDDPAWHTFGEQCPDSDVVTLERGVPSVFEEFGNVRGKPLFLEVHKAPFHDASGAVIGTVGSARNMTERHHAILALEESEARFRNLANMAPVFIWLVDATPRCTWANQRWLDFTGRPLEALNAGWHDLVHPDDQGRLVETFVRASAQRAPFELKYRIRRRDGAYRSVIDQGWPRVAADGSFDGYVGWCLDVTEQLEAEEALRHAREAADAANHAKSEFLANMSHEIRTPLNGVLGNIQLLELTQTTPEQREYLAAIGASGSNLLSLINEILDLSKLEADKVTLEAKPFGLRRCVDGVVRMHRARATDKGVRLSTKVHEAVPDALVGDELRLRQILSNLIGNALKFTHEGSVDLIVSGRTGSAHSVVLDLIVQDTGIGIPKTLQRDIFEPFVQADSSITRRYGGTGLGLSICRRLANLMGGSIGVESAESQGSRFLVSLPFSIARAGSPITAKPTPVEPGTRRLRVLLADGDEVNRHYGSELLGKLGHTVTAVADGPGVLSALAAGPDRAGIDVVLIDAGMPPIDGMTAPARIRAVANVPVVALTAYDSEEETRRLRALGYDGVVRKQLVSKRLLHELHRVLEARP